MADIRKTPMLDDFQRANEDPLSYEGRWTLHEQVSIPGVHVMRLESGSVEVHAVTGGSVVSALWTGQRMEAFATNEAEVWGHVTGTHDIREGVRMFLHVARPGAFAFGQGYQGYLARWIDPIGAPGFEILRADGGGLTSLGGALGGFFTGDGWMLFRRVGSDGLELWIAPGTGGAGSPPGTWTLALAVTDGTYNVGYFGIGTSQDDDNPAWDAFGGGNIRKTQIYRYVTN